MEQDRLAATSRSVIPMRVVGLMLLMLTWSAHGQGTPYVQKVPKPEVYGQWAGPWDLKSFMQIEPGTGGAEYSPIIKEIGHSIVLPPDKPATAATSVLAGQVVFMNFRPFTENATTEDQPTFLWNPSEPDQLPDANHLIIPNDPDNDVFCSGHTYLGDGRPLTGGGEDITTQAIQDGAGQSFVLTTDLLDPFGNPGPLQWLSIGNPASKRWYPTLTTLHDGVVLVAGDSGNLSSGGPPIDEYHQTLDAADAVPDWSPDRVNLRQIAACASSPNLAIDHYPRLHLLTTRQLMWANGTATTELIPQGVFPQVSYFLPVDPNVTNCTGSANDQQWVEGTADPADPDNATQFGGQSVHLVFLDVEPPSPTEVVYYFGGTSSGNDDNKCPQQADPAAYSPSNRVARMQDPGPFKMWDTTVADMTYGRINANAVILLDGSILIVGGSDNDGSGCTSQQIPERFKPDEIFFGSEGGTWKDMLDQLGSERLYHSVDGLLPSGDVFSAGGQGEGDEYSVDLFSPHYMFRLPRPKIDVNTLNAAWAIGSGLDEVFDVEIREGGTPNRIALIRPGNATHAFDQSQRYVRLKQTQTAFQPDPVNDPSRWRMQVEMPADGYQTPPGWYMLTVRSLHADPNPPYATTGRQSEAQWVFLQ